MTTIRNSNPLKFKTGDLVQVRRGTRYRHGNTYEVTEFTKFGIILRAFRIGRNGNENVDVLIAGLGPTGIMAWDCELV